jgi:hypothetical protein
VETGQAVAMVLNLWAVAIARSLRVVESGDWRGRPDQKPTLKSALKIGGRWMGKTGVLVALKLALMTGGEGHGNQTIFKKTKRFLLKQIHFLFSMIFITLCTSMNFVARVVSNP